MNVYNGAPDQATHLRVGKPKHVDVRSSYQPSPQPSPHGGDNGRTRREDQVGAGCLSRIAVNPSKGSPQLQPYRITATVALLTLDTFDICMRSSCCCQQQPHIPTSPGPRLQGITLQLSPLSICNLAVTYRPLLPWALIPFKVTNPSDAPSHKDDGQPSTHPASQTSPEPHRRVTGESVLPPVRDPSISSSLTFPPPKPEDRFWN